MATVFSLTPVFRPVIWTWQMHQSFHDFANEKGSEAFETPAARRFRQGTWLKPGVNEMPLYVVKINLIPAMTSTVARQSEITRTAKRLLPRCEPMMPPIIAAAARMNPSDGME